MTMRTLLIYLCSLAATNPASAMDVHAPAEVIVENGTTGILKCSFKSYEAVSSSATVTWTFRPTGSDLVPYTVFYYGGGKGFAFEEFKKRVQFIGDFNQKDVSIQLLLVQPNDEGTYFCDVKNPPDVLSRPSGTELRVTLRALQSVQVSEQDESTHGNCSTDAQNYEHLSSELQKVLECKEYVLPQWSTEQTAKLLISMRNLANSIHQQQLKACQEPDLGNQTSKCPNPMVPDNGGLACVTVNKHRYCKPMCNNGFDFRFLSRRSRLYERCGKDTRFSWQSGYTGGNTLADCIESSIRVSGGATAYFQQDCLTTQSSNNSTIETFIAELKEQGVAVDGATSYACLACGRPAV